MKPVMNKIKVTETCGLNPFFVKVGTKQAWALGYLVKNVRLIATVLGAFYLIIKK